MKQIKITGKNNIEKLFKPNNDHKTKVSENFFNKKNKLLNEFTHKNQIDFVNNIYMGNDFEMKKITMREIKKKHASYKNQDIKKGVFNEEMFIKNEEIIEKLVVSKLKCFYCKIPMMILYDNVRENCQWTLDRIDNNLGHNNGNVVISCLKCNLQRRTLKMEHFKFTKQLKIIKK